MPRQHALHHESYEVTLPVETFGLCQQRPNGKRCTTTGAAMLANGLCMACWDRSIQDQDSAHKRTYERGKRRDQ